MCRVGTSRYGRSLIVYCDEIDCPVCAYIPRAAAMHVGQACDGEMLREARGLRSESGCDAPPPQTVNGRPVGVSS